MERKSILIIFVTAILILIAIHYLLFTSTSELYETEKSISRAELIILESEMLLNRLNTAERFRNYYFFTGNTKYKKNLSIALEQSDSVFMFLKKHTAGNQYENQVIDSILILLNQNKLFSKMSYENDLLKKDNIAAKLETDFRENEFLKKIYILAGRIRKEEEKSRELLKIDSEKYSSYRGFYLIAGISSSLILIIWGAVLIARNSRKRKETEKALEDSKNWFYTTLKSIGDGIIVTNQLGDITFMNPVAQMLTGWDESEARGLYLEHIFNVINEETRERIENPVTSVFKSGKISSLGYYSLLISKEGKEIPIDDSAAPIISNDGNIMGVIIVFRDASERRKAEREILRNQRFIQRIAESIPNILYVYEISGPKIIYANNKMKEILGYSAEEAIKMESDYFNKLIHPDDFERISSYFNGYSKYADKEVMESEFRIKNSKGEWRWLHNYDVIFTRDSEGNPYQIVGTALDVTEKKAMEEQLKKYSVHLEETVKKRTSELVLTNEKLKQEIIERINAEKSISEAEEKFRSLVEYSLVGIYIVQDGIIVYANPKFEEIFGYESEELVGMKFSSLIKTDYADIESKNIELRLKDLTGDIQYTFKGLKKDGKVIDAEIRGTKMMYNEKLAVIGSLNDVTERKTAEEELRKSQERLKFHIQKTPLGVIELDLNFRIVDWNESAEKMFGFSPDEAMGKNALNLIVPERGYVNFSLALENLLSRSGDARSTITNITKDGREILCEWYNTPLIDNEGKVVGIASLVEDITVRKKSEEHLKKSLKEKELLVQEVHHRVKNNLQIIISLLKLQSKYIFDKRDLEIFNKSRARIETMSLIHEKLYKSSDLENINMCYYLEELTGYLFKAYGLTKSDYLLNIKSEEVYLGIDTAIPCGLIINELISNSLKHAFRINQTGEININLSRQNGSIQLMVSDNGTGLPKDFVVEDSESLGLQLVSTLIKQLDGEISIDSSPKGAVFNIKFPEMKYKVRI